MSKIFTQVLIKESIKRRTVNKIKRHINANEININSSNKITRTPIKLLNWTTPIKNRKERTSWVES
jgi:hypothetical protein